MSSLPLPFQGTEEQRVANRDSHSYFYTGGPDDADIRCMECDCRPSHKAADYPCGTDVPRYDATAEEVEEAWASFVTRQRAFGAAVTAVQQ